MRLPIGGDADAAADATSNISECGHDIRHKECKYCGSWCDEGDEGDPQTEFVGQWFCRRCWDLWHAGGARGPAARGGSKQAAAVLESLMQWQFPRALPRVVRHRISGLPVRRLATWKDQSPLGPQDLAEPLVLPGAWHNKGRPSIFRILPDLSAVDVEVSSSLGQRDVVSAMALLCSFEMGQGVLGYSEGLLEGVDPEDPLWAPTPEVLDDDMSEIALPEFMRPICKRALLVQGPGTATILRRDPQAWYGWDISVLGSKTWYFYPPAALPTHLHVDVGDLGFGIASCSEASRLSDEGTANDDDDDQDHGSGGEPMFYQVQQQPGDCVIVPPGWFYQTCSVDGCVSVLGYHLPAAAIPAIVRAVLGSDVADSVHTPDRLRKALEEAFAARPAGDRPCRTSVHQFVHHHARDRDSAVCSFASVLGSFDDRIRQLLFEEFPTFTSSGVCIPEDAPQWSEIDFRRFLQSGGAIKPCRRLAVEAPRCSFLEEAWLNADKYLLARPGPEELATNGDHPCIIWSYWAQGAGRLPRFRRLCALSWAVQNAGWHYILLDLQSLFLYIQRQDLPEHWERMGHEHAADAVRLALLARYGGVWTDVGSICLRPLQDDIWPAVCTSRCGMGAFFYSYHGKVPGESREYVENWFVAARRGHPFIAAWHQTFLRAWAGRWRAEDVHEDPMFQGLDLSHLSLDQRRYLTMHVTFTKVVQEQADLRKFWEEDMLLLRADDHVLGWMAGVDSREDVVRRWVYKDDPAWVDELAAGAPLIKFIGKFARPLDTQPLQHLLRRRNNVRRLLLYALFPAAPGEAQEWLSCATEDADFEIAD